MLKKTTLFLIFWFCLFSSNAQVKNNLSLVVEAGFVTVSDTEKLGLFFHLEPKIKSSENTIIGLRMGLTINSQTIESKDLSQFIIEDEFDHGFFSFLPTVDYYFNGVDFRPYLGVGAGVCLVGNYMDVSPIIEANNSMETLEGTANKKIGLLCRGGFEMNRLRLSIEYNWIPEANVDLSTGQTVGSVESSYLGLSLGFRIGAGKKVI